MNRWFSMLAVALALVLAAGGCNSKHHWSDLLHNGQDDGSPEAQFNLGVNYMKEDPAKAAQKA